MAKKEFAAGAMLAPLPCAMVSLSDGEEDNIITIAWTGIINSDPPMTYISVRPSRHSYQMLKNSMEFVINLPNSDMVYAMDYCGCRTGAKENKFETAHLTKAKASKVSCPMIEECPINLECKVVEIKPFPSHDMFIAEIVAVHVDENLVSKEGHIKVNKADLVGFVHSEYYQMDTKKLGSFGYSVMKPKTAKKRRSEGKSTGGKKAHWKKEKK